MKGNRFLLLGLGSGNIALKNYFDEENTAYTIYDDNIEKHRKNVDFNNFDFVIKSSGIVDEHFIVKYSKKLNKNIITDLEAFYLFSNDKNIITVTGSNGKTTTVSLIKYILKDIDLGGNIGAALGNFIKSNNDIIIESSSFMLDYIANFRANINVYLNINPNHLDHHGNFKNYILAKLKMVKNIKSDDYLIYNYDDKLLRRIFKNLDVKKIPFSINYKQDLYIDNNLVYYKDNQIFDLSNFPLKGKHNQYNLLASIAAIIAYDKEKLNKLTLFKDFSGLEHRLEYLGKINKLINVYNDSKSTNFSALNSALSSFKNNNILLICGGKSKPDNFELINQELKQIKVIIINGENKEELARFFIEKNKKILVFDKLESSLNVIKDNLENIDTVLFSPASSSYDQFNNYIERGNFFKKRIKEIFELEGCF